MRDYSMHYIVLWLRANQASLGDFSNVQRDVSAVRHSHLHVSPLCPDHDGILLMIRMKQKDEARRGLHQCP